MAAVPFHLHPMRHALMAQAPELAAAVMRRSEREGKQWGGIMDVDAALSVFRHLSEHEDLAGELRAVVLNDSHFFAYSVGPLWFVPGATFLVEQFFMRVGRGQTTAALTDVEDLGRSLGCRFVLMATSLAANDEALGRLLRSHGYRPHSSQHLKELI